MIRILQICNKAPYPTNDGSSIAIYNMAQGLLSNHVELHLLTINTKKHYKEDGRVPLEFRERSHYHSVFKNTNTSLTGAFLSLFSAKSYFASRFHFREFEKALGEKLRNQTFDIVQLEGLFMGSYIPFIRRQSQARIVLRAHNIEHFIWNRHILGEESVVKKWYLRLQNKRLRRFELLVLESVDAVVPISLTDEQEFRRLECKKPIFTCITGVDVKFYQQKLNIPVKPLTVFYFGSMDWLPNQEAARWFIHHCWRKVLQEVPNARLIIAGRGMPLEFFHITAPNVSIIENVENGKMFFEQHEIMIVPLHSGSGLRIKIVEGMSYGKAIVSTSIGAEGIRYENGRDILIADDAVSFSNAVISLLRDANKRKELERNAAQTARSEFDNMAVVEKLVRFYESLLHG